MTPIVTLQAITQSPRAHLAGSGHQARPYRKTTFEPHPRVLTAKLLGRGAGTFEEHREDPGHEVGTKVDCEGGNISRYSFQIFGEKEGGSRTQFGVRCAKLSYHIKSVMRSAT